MRNIVFVAPFPMETTLRFAHALRGLSGVRLLGVWQEAPRGPDRAIFDDVVTVGNALSENALTEGVSTLARRHGPPDRILGVLEDLQVPLATVRQRFGVPGMTPAVARRFRDKGLMKDALRAAGLPCARHARLRSAKAAWDFVEEVGFPVVLKPPAGAGCRSTWRVDSPQALTEALREIAPSSGREVLAEEFLTGAEHSYETITVGGVPRFTSISRYYPGPLEVMRTPWIQWVVVLPREVHTPAFAAAHAVGQKAVTALGLDAGMTHMEWFRRPDGSVAIGEIAARPPGAQIVKLTGLAHEADLHRAWARAVVDGAFDGPWERKHAVGIAFLRGLGNGRVAGVDGLDDAQRAMGHLVVEARLPQVGAPRAEGYEGEGWAIVRHPDTEVVKAGLRELIERVKVRYA